LDSSAWQEFYASNLQSVYAPIAVPLLFLAYRALRGRPAGGRREDGRFVDGYAIAVAVETIADAIATGPLTRALDIAGSAAGTALMLTFVLLGDFRVYLLVFGLLSIEDGKSWTTAVGRAAAFTTLVPAVAYPTNALLGAFVEHLDPNSIWLVYEVIFVLVALILRERLLGLGDRIAPATRRYLSAVLLYVAGYYALWAMADAFIQLADRDLGWAIRMVPNQLYYAWWAPFVFWAFFRGRLTRKLNH
jgi:hypothetical protein